MNTLFLSLWENLMCLNCFTLKFLNFKVCDSNLTVEILHILNFIKLLTQLINIFS